MLKDFLASIFAELKDFSSSLILFTILIPFPPPPLAALIIIGKPNSFAYNLTKHALASMAKTTALDYAAFNIRANAVCPGTIETPLFHNAIDAYCQRSGADKAEIVAEEAALQPLGRLGQPEEIAALVNFLISPEASFITGSLQSIDGGYTTQ